MTEETKITQEELDNLDKRDLLMTQHLALAIVYNAKRDALGAEGPKNAVNARLWLLDRDPDAQLTVGLVASAADLELEDIKRETKNLADVMPIYVHAEPHPAARWRLAHNLSLSAVAKAIGQIDRAYLAHIECGDVWPREGWIMDKMDDIVDPTNKLTETNRSIGVAYMYEILKDVTQKIKHIYLPPGDKKHTRPGVFYVI